MGVSALNIHAQGNKHKQIISRRNTDSMLFFPNKVLQQNSQSQSLVTKHRKKFSYWNKLHKCKCCNSLDTESCQESLFFPFMCWFKRPF